jgi:hypothetical protein
MSKLPVSTGWSVPLSTSEDSIMGQITFERSASFETYATVPPVPMARAALAPLIKGKAVKGTRFDDDPTEKSWFIIEFIDGSTLYFSDYVHGPLVRYVPGPAKKDMVRIGINF